MNEFEELLSNVLAADVCVDPPDGMESRIKAALSAATARPPLLRRFLREAVAAVLVMGFVGMLAVRYHNQVVPAATPNEERSTAKAAMLGVAAGTATVRAGSPKREFGRRSVRLVRSRQSSRRVVVGIAPIAVESLVIDPVEVASLASNKRTEQSLGWGEQR